MFGHSPLPAVKVKRDENGKLAQSPVTSIVPDEFEHGRVSTAQHHPTQIKITNVRDVKG